jgi:hypothetical protein
MKKLCLIIFMALCSITFSHAQTNTSPTQVYEWNNSGNVSGELIVVYVNAGTIGSFTGAAIVGQIIDGTSNWGYTLPIVANFKLSINFTLSTYSLVQDVITPDITLEIKSMSANQVVLVANCANLFKQSRVLFRYTNGQGATLAIGDPTVVNPSGTMLVPQPKYGSNLSGTLLIGKTTQNNTSYILDVAGNARFNQVSVNTTGADFVFNPTYRLLPLTDLKTYLNQYHHLPNIPSAQKMKENGLDLGQNQTRLLQKIEELTLYTIAADKEIKAEKELITQQQILLLKLQNQLQLHQQEIEQLKNNK